MDNVCGLMQNYGTTTDPKTGERGFMRINSRAGESITISNVNFSSGGTEELKSAVSSLKLKTNLRCLNCVALDVKHENHK